MHGRRAGWIKRDESILWQRLGPLLRGKPVVIGDIRKAIIGDELLINLSKIYTLEQIRGKMRCLQKKMSKGA